jgi:hypothetical protein
MPSLPRTTRTQGFILLFLLLAACLTTTPYRAAALCVLSLAIWYDAWQRLTPQYLRIWSWYLLAAAGLGAIERSFALPTVTLILILASYLTATAYEPRLTPRRRWVIGVTLAEAAILCALIQASPLLQATVAVLPALAVIHLLQPSEAAGRWKQVRLFGILGLLLLVALAIRAAIYPL